MSGSETRHRFGTAIAPFGHRSMVAILSLFAVVVLSILVTRVATIALIQTGLARETARFQARSAFTGAGFTTAESERIVRHPVRRRIVRTLMLLGNAGLVTAVTTLMLTFVGGPTGASSTTKIAFLSAGLAALYWFGSSEFVDRHLSRLMERLLRRYTDLEIRDHASLLHLDAGYRLVEMLVEADSWLAGRRLAELQLKEEGVLVLGVERDDDGFRGAPDKHTRLLVGDVVYLYGRAQAIDSLATRKEGERGDRAHDVRRRRAERTKAAERAADPDA